MSNHWILSSLKTFQVYPRISAPLYINTTILPCKFLTLLAEGAGMYLEWGHWLEKSGHNHPTIFIRVKSTHVLRRREFEQLKTTTKNMQVLKSLEIILWCFDASSIGWHIKEIFVYFYLWSLKRCSNWLYAFFMNLIAVLLCYCQCQC